MAVQTIQQTGKVWKFAIMVGALAMLAGVVAIVAALVSPAKAGGTDMRFVWGVLAFVGGLFLFCLGRVCAWWFHG